ncbi:MAG TPA: hypothetical protein VHR66_09455 [Gemmataceae bacterium]|jgi:hypothetical protein|nr:hypothetical protein [Gemmataceae bacterium]
MHDDRSLEMVITDLEQVTERLRNLMGNKSLSHMPEAFGAMAAGELAGTVLPAMVRLAKEVNELKKR